MLAASAEGTRSRGEQLLLGLGNALSTLLLLHLLLVLLLPCWLLLLPILQLGLLLQLKGCVLGCWRACRKGWPGGRAPPLLTPADTAATASERWCTAHPVYRVTCLRIWWPDISFPIQTW